MRSHTWWMFGVAWSVGLAACGGGGQGGGPAAVRGVARDVAEKACAHQIALGFWQGFEKSFKANGLEFDAAARDEGAKELEKLKSDPEYQAELAKCTDGFAKLATQANIDCVLAAKTSANAQACLKP